MAVLAGWYTLPDPPELEGGRWFRTLLANLLVAEIETAGGDGEDWERRVSDFLPGDDWKEQGRWAVLDDPIELGPDYDPSTWLGSSVGWEGLVDWPTVSAVLRRLWPTHWILVDGAEPSQLLATLAEELGDLAVRHEWTGADLDDASDAIAKCAETRLSQGAERFVLVGAGEGAHLVTRAMARNPGLRDRASAVLAVGGVLQGHPDQEGSYGAKVLSDWMSHWFTHDKMDTERVGATPWFHLLWEGGLPASVAAFVEPSADTGDPWGIEVVGLGSVRVTDDLVPVARALWVLLGCWGLSRR